MHFSLLHTGAVERCGEEKRIFIYESVDPLFIPHSLWTLTLTFFGHQMWFSFRHASLVIKWCWFSQHREFSVLSHVSCCIQDVYFILQHDANCQTATCSRVLTAKPRIGNSVRFASKNWNLFNWILSFARRFWRNLVKTYDTNSSASSSRERCGCKKWGKLLRHGIWFTMIAVN